MSDSRRSFELTALFTLAEFTGKIIAATAILSRPTLKECDRKLIEDLMKGTEERRDMLVDILQKSYPSFWKEIQRLEVYKEDQEAIEYMRKEEKGNE